MFHVVEWAGRGIRDGWDMERDGMAFVLRPSMGDVLKCLWCALRHTPMLKRSVQAAALVSTVLIALNQGDVMLAGDWMSHCTGWCR